MSIEREIENSDLMVLLINCTLTYFKYTILLGYSRDNEVFSNIVVTFEWIG